MSEFLSFKVFLLLPFVLHSFDTRMFHLQLSVCTRLSIKNLFFIISFALKSFYYLLFIYLAIRESSSNLYFHIDKNRALATSQAKQKQVSYQDRKTNFYIIYTFILFYGGSLRNSIFIIYVHVN